MSVNDPSLLSVSENSKYLYVGLSGASTVQRMTLPGLATDIAIPLGSSSVGDPYNAMDVQAAPNSDETVAVVRGSTAEESSGGVWIYDGATARPDTLCGAVPIASCVGQTGVYDTIQWNADGIEMFASDNEDTGFNFYTAPVTSAGFGAVTAYSGSTQSIGGWIHYDKTTQYVYSDNGMIVDPATGQIVGSFDASGVMVPDGVLGTAFIVGKTSLDTANSYTVESFDMQTLAPIATLQIQNVVGMPARVIRWGTNGLAFTTFTYLGAPNPGQAVYLISGSFVGAPQATGPRPAENVRRTWKDERLQTPHGEDEAP